MAHSVFFSKQATHISKCKFCHSWFVFLFVLSLEKKYNHKRPLMFDNRYKFWQNTHTDLNICTDTKTKWWESRLCLCKPYHLQFVLVLNSFYFKYWETYQEENRPTINAPCCFTIGTSFVRIYTQIWIFCADTETKIISSIMFLNGLKHAFRNWYDVFARWGSSALGGRFRLD